MTNMSFVGDSADNDGPLRISFTWWSRCPYIKRRFQQEVSLESLAPRPRLQFEPPAGARSTNYTSEVRLGESFEFIPPPELQKTNQHDGYV